MLPHQEYFVVRLAISHITKYLCILRLGADIANAVKELTALRALKVSECKKVISLSLVEDLVAILPSPIKSNITSLSITKCDRPSTKYTVNQAEKAWPAWLDHFPALTTLEIDPIAPINIYTFKKLAQRLHLLRIVYDSFPSPPVDGELVLAPGSH